MERFILLNIVITSRRTVINKVHPLIFHSRQNKVRAKQRLHKVNLQNLQIL